MKCAAFGNAQVDRPVKRSARLAANKARSIHVQRRCNECSFHGVCACGEIRYECSTEPLAFFIVTAETANASAEGRCQLSVKNRATSVRLARARDEYPLVRKRGTEFQCRLMRLKARYAGATIRCPGTSP